MEAMEKDFEDLVESEDTQEEDIKSILDYFDDEGNIIGEEDDSDNPDVSFEDEDDPVDGDDSLTSEEFVEIIENSTDEEFEALPDEFFTDIPEEILADVELTEDDLPEGETDLQELAKKSLGARLKARKAKKKWARTGGGKKSARKAERRAKKVASGAIRVDKKRGRAMKKAARLYNSYIPETDESTDDVGEAVVKKSLGARLQARKERKKYMRTSGGKRYAVKQKKRQKKVAAGAIRVDKKKSINRKRWGRVYGTAAEDYNASEDVGALLSGEEFTEEFKTKATTIFESAVQKRVDEELKAHLLIQQEDIVEESLEAIMDIEDELTTKLDSYLDYIVEEWMEDNKIAVEKGMKVEVTENFLSGLRNLFEASYIEVPEGKVDALEDLSEKVSKLQEELDRQIQSNVELKEENDKYLRDDIFIAVSDGMVDTDIEKFKSLTEAVSFNGNIDEYTEKIETIKENYFNDSTVKTTLTEETDESTYGTSDPIMSAYASALGRYS